MEKNLLNSKINEIVNLIQRKQFIVSEKKARELVKMLNVKEPEQYNAFVTSTVLIAESLTKNVKNLLALEELEKANKRFPEEERFLEEVFNLAIKLKRFPRAEEALRDMVKLNPSKIDNRFKLINFYLEKEDYLSAALELRKLAGLGVYDFKVNMLLLLCLKKSGSLSEQLRQIKLLQKLAPDNSSLVIEEIHCLLGMGCYSQAYDLLDSFIRFKLESEVFDAELADSLTGLANLFIYHGNKDILAEHLICMLSQPKKSDGATKHKLEKFSGSMKWDIIFNFYLKNNLKIKPVKLTEPEIIENILLLLQNGCDTVKLKAYLKNNEIDKMIQKDYQPFIESLLEVERTEAS